MSLDYNYAERIVQVIDEDRKLNVSEYILHQDINKILADVEQKAWENAREEVMYEVKQDLVDYIEDF